jgi:hypothetical protein
LIEHDPSPSGLAKAFVSLESKLVGVYSAWAEVVGSLIMAGLGREVVGARQRSAGENGMLKKRRSLRTTVEKNGEHENEHRLQLGDVVSDCDVFSQWYKAWFPFLVVAAHDAHSENQPVYITVSKWVPEPRALTVLDVVIADI